MRVLSILALSAFVSLIALGGGAAALVRAPRPHGEELILEAILECGVFDGRFQCRAATGGRPHGKSAPGAVRKPPPAESPGPWTGDTAPGAAAPDSGQAPADNAATCKNGMVGTPPNCFCPENSELLGGNCVHYTATCKNGLPANAPPQQCPKAEQKLACKARSDGLKDCCCITYDKF